jgi:hypothetical protein
MKVNTPQDNQWKQQREQRWEKVWKDSLRVHGVSKKNKDEEVVIAAQRQWYIHGDLTSLMDSPDSLEKQDALSMVSVMELCPIVDVEQYVQFFQEYALWASNNEVSYWGSDVVKRDDRFISAFFGRYVGDHRDSTKEIYQHMLKMLLPDDDGVIRFPLTLGIDRWQPQQQVALCDCAADVLNKFRLYLFGEEGKYSVYSHISVALPIVKYIKDLNPKYFDTQLIDAKPKRPAPAPTPRRVVGAAQELLRAILGNVQGYKSDLDKCEGPLRHNDPEVEQALRDLLAGLPMPEEYYCLIEFIHAHPKDYSQRSE